MGDLVSARVAKQKTSLAKFRIKDAKQNSSRLFAPTCAKRKNTAQASAAGANSFKYLKGA
ncbi:MAG: hypothetical protein J6J04_05815 [Oscillospiraceae bacterium]|nr:hypothetical protein [Oscillospiraceae bacterium]